MADEEALKAELLAALDAVRRATKHKKTFCVSLRSHLLKATVREHKYYMK